MRADAAAMTFTLAEFARVSPHLHAAALVDMLAEAAELRATHPAPQPADDDLADPGEGDQVDHERMIMRLTRLVTSIASALAMSALHVESPRERMRRRQESREVVLGPVPGAPVGSM